MGGGQPYPARAIEMQIPDVGRQGGGKVQRLETAAAIANQARRRCDPDVSGRRLAQNGRKTRRWNAVRRSIAMELSGGAFPTDQGIVRPDGGDPDIAARILEQTEN